MTLSDILKAKGSTVYTISAQASLQEATQALVRHNVGALVVCDRDLEAGERLLGIITERDITRVCAADRGPLSAILVGEVMTTRLLTGSPQDSVEDTMGLMTSHRIRHIPVLAEGRMVGIVSIGDVVKSQHDRLAMENQFMKNYITS
jgi:CBS domain-containing protein